MRLIITDTGLIWNEKNPYLEQFKESVLVVCLHGKKVTDKYECFVSPYQAVGLGQDNYGAESNIFKALASVSKDLNRRFGYHDKVVFLTDGEPSSLYPFYALKDLVEFNSVHLITMAPFSFEPNSRINAHRTLLSDLSSLKSLLYLDPYQYIGNRKDPGPLPDLIDYIQNDIGKKLPRILNGISEMYLGKYYYDFASEDYILLDDGFKGLDLSPKENVSEVDFDIRPSCTTLGMIIPPHYPVDVDEAGEEVEQLIPRLNGKKICNVLREQRIRLAEANGISFFSAECPSIGPCAGTCVKCDEEVQYLTAEMEKIPIEERKYPKFDPAEEVKEI